MSYELRYRFIGGKYDVCVSAENEDEARDKALVEIQSLARSAKKRPPTKLRLIASGFVMKIGH